MKAPKKEKRPSHPVTLPDGSGATDEYLEAFRGKKDETKLSVALERAHDTRKFEIDLYWKRATYFWAFNAVVFAGYFAMSSRDNASADMLFIINCLGLLFSLGWYLANRGSKFWQLNWEIHVDLLENDVTGPLYKTILEPTQFKASKITGPYAFSVSRLNTVLSGYAVGIWVFLGIRAITAVLDWGEPFPGFNILILTLLTVFCVFLLFSQGKSRIEDPGVVLKRRRVHARILNSKDGASGGSA